MISPRDASIERLVLYERRAVTTSAAYIVILSTVYQEYKIKSNMVRAGEL